MKISVIIPVYDAEETLEKCVASVAAQGFSPHEILLVDDGSPGGTALAERLEREIPCVRLLRQEHGGASQARNRGLQEAGGDWILFLDADDLLEEGAFSALAAGITVETDACCGRILRGTEPEGKKKKETVLQLCGSELLDRALSAPTDLLTLHGWVFRKSLCGGVLFRPDLRMGEDSEWMLRVLPAARNAALVPQAVYRYTISPGSAVHRWKPGQADAYLRTLEVIRETSVAGEKNWPLFVLTTLLLILTHDTFHPANPAGAGGQLREARRLRKLPVFREALRDADLSSWSLGKRMVLRCFRAGWMLPVYAAVKARQRQNAGRI